MQLRWIAHRLATLCYAAAGFARGLPVADSQLAEPLIAPALALRQRLRKLGLPEPTCWRELLAYAPQADSCDDLAHLALGKVLGIAARTVSQVAELAQSLRELERAGQRALPHLLDEWEHRVRPLQQHWEARGPGLLHAVGTLTDQRLLVDQATIVAIPPLFGGGGDASLATNTVHMEAVLTNVVDGLPEVVRLGWLLSQLNHDLPVINERVPSTRLYLLAKLAMLPPILQAGETVELTTLSTTSITTALDAWRIEATTNRDLPKTLLDWWETYLETKPSWGVALAALDHMLPAEPNALEKVNES